MSPLRSGAILRAYVWPRRRQVALLAVLLFAGLAADLGGPLILRQFIDTALGQGPLQDLVALAILFLVVALLTQGVRVAEAYVAQNVGLQATNQLRADLTRHLLQLDPDFHNSHTPGELIERVDGDVATLANFFSRFSLQLVGNGLLLIGVLVLLTGIDWRVGLAVGAFSVLALLLMERLRHMAVPYWAAARQASAELFGFLEERLAGTEDIRASGATAYTLQRLHERSRALLRRQRRAAALGGATGGLMRLMLWSGTALALGVGGYLYTAGALTLGTVYLIFNYTQLLQRPIEEISRQLQDLQQAGAGLARVRALLAERSRIGDGSGPPLPGGALSVAFDDVTFAYGDGDPAVCDLGFALAPGQVLGVLGRTGSGKTTLTRLLFRLYDPNAGAIRLGGVPLPATRIGDLRTRVGLVTQEIHLFHATLRDNLTFFDRSIPDARIRQVLDDLGLGPLVAALPDGLDTRLAPGGSGLSAGQAQLVAFARVFLRDPGLVILDEASSRLDPATEAQVEHAVDRLLAGRTGIVIAHRLATVARADTILILEEGRVVEYGPRAVLTADPDSRFAHLLRTGLQEVLA